MSQLDRLEALAEKYNAAVARVAQLADELGAGSQDPLLRNAVERRYDLGEIAGSEALDALPDLIRVARAAKEAEDFAESWMPYPQLPSRCEEELRDLLEMLKAALAPLFAEVES